MSLSNTVKTNLLDPVVHNNTRTEFHLPDAFYSSAIRLIDLGVYDEQATKKTGLYYPSMLGVLASIKKLTLYSGAVIIDEIQELPHWATLQHMKTSNRGSEDINRFELLNGASLSLVDDVFSYENKYKDYAQYYGDSNSALRHHNQFQLAAAESDQISGSINLADYLGLLASNPILPGLPKLRLVIDWELSYGKYFQDEGAVTAVATPSFRPIRPTMVLEEIMNQQPLKQMKLGFLSTMVERFVVSDHTAADALGTAKSHSYRSNAFKNRYLKNLVFVNKVTSDTSGGGAWMRADERSKTQRGEILQLVINGRKFLPDQGINNEAMKMQYLNDTLGSLNVPAYAFYEGLPDVNGQVCTTDGDDLVANYSVTAVRVEDNIERIDVEYTHQKNTAAADPDTGFTLLMFGQCARQLEVVNGVTRLSY